MYGVFRILLHFVLLHLVLFCTYFTHFVGLNDLVLTIYTYVCIWSFKVKFVYQICVLYIQQLNLYQKRLVGCVFLLYMYCWYNSHIQCNMHNGNVRFLIKLRSYIIHSNLPLRSAVASSHQQTVSQMLS